jgi:CHAT domain-containing protein
LERQIRDLARRADGGSVDGGGSPVPDGGPVEAPPTVRQLSAALGDAALVELIEHDGRALAVVVRDGRCSLHDLGSQDHLQRQLLLHLFSLRRLVTLGDSATTRAVAGRAAAAIDDALLRPLHHEIDKRPLVLVPSGPLHGVPWSALPSCAGRPVTVAPSATAWLRASGRIAPARAPVLVAGPRLPAANTEVAALAQHLPAARVLTGPAATAGETLRALDGAGLAHIAAHGTFRADNPLFSTVELADGPLTGYELERLRRPPGCLVLSACDAGRSAVRPGEELIGFTAVLLGLGTRCLIASLLPVPAERTTDLMLDLHRRMAAGYGPARALAEAQQDFADGADGIAYATAAAFVCSGAG